MPYGIYLPPGYDGAQARYPVLYMLHGIGGHYSEWVAYGLAETAERLIEAGQIGPLIIVFPQGDESYFVNHARGDGEPWGDYTAIDLVAHIDATYRTIPAREGRATVALKPGTLRHPSSSSCIPSRSTNSGLMKQSRSAGFRPNEMSATKMRRPTPTCVAASPMPGAAYIVCTMSSIS
jgi:enterochelin esterase-like enzyme